MWCFRKDQALLEGASDFTILIKNNIEFPKFDMKKYGTHNKLV